MDKVKLGGQINLGYVVSSLWCRDMSDSIVEHEHGLNHDTVGPNHSEVIDLIRNYQTDLISGSLKYRSHRTDLDSGS